MKLFRNAIANVRAALERRGRALVLPPSPEALALEAVNPLRGIGVSGAQDIFDAARRGNFATLGRVYAEIESADPTLLVVSERRGGALSDLAWRMKDADGRAPGFDAGLAREQAQAAEGMLAGAENFGAAVEHLAGAFFRGAALAQPRFLEDGTLLGFVLVPLEAACYDASRDMWQLNPSLSPQEPGAGAPGLVDVPPEDGMVSVSRRRHIDYPALMVYIRAALGERHWGRFVDRFGLPPAVLTMPPMAAAEDEDRFLRAARAAADGRTVALPNGSGVTFASDARGVNPFSEYLRHQQELVVLMATGGLLTTLAESGSGTLAGSAHQETWRQVVRKDARVVAEALQAQLVAPWLRRMFPGRPVCSVFDFDAEPAPTASEVLDDAVKARSAGYEMAADELAEKTGYTLRPAPEPGAGAVPGSQFPVSRSPLLNSRKPETGNGKPETPRTALSALADAFRSDLGPAADELKKLLDLPDAELADGARELMGRLDDLLPSDPETAAVLAEEMAKAFAEGAGEATEHTEHTETLANEDREKNGQFAEKGTGNQTGGGSGTPAKSGGKKGEDGEKKDGGGSADAEEKRKSEERARRLAERESLLTGGLTPIKLDQAKSVLLEPVTVTNAEAGGSFRFTSEKLLGEQSHLKKDHLDSDYRRRARVLLYAIDTAKTSKNFENKKSSKPNEWGVYEMRKELKKTYKDKETGKPFTVVVRADRNGDVFEVFDLFPK